MDEEASSSPPCIEASLTISDLQDIAVSATQHESLFVQSGSCGEDEIPHVFELDYAGAIGKLLPVDPHALFVLELQEDEGWDAAMLTKSYCQQPS